MPQEFDRFPLSESQRNIWNLERAYPGTSINHISTTVKINGRLDFALLQESISDLLRRDATLRLRIVETAEGLFQYAAPYADEHFPSMIFFRRVRRGPLPLGGGRHAREHAGT